MQIICSVATEAKIRHDAIKILNKFKEHLSRRIFGCFHTFFQLFLVVFCQEAEFSCRTHKDSSRKPGNIKIGLYFYKHPCRTHYYLLDRMNFVKPIWFPGVKLFYTQNMKPCSMCFSGNSNS